MTLINTSIFKILHQTPTRLRMKLSAPLTPSIQNFLKEQLSEMSPTITYQWFPSTRSFVVNHDQGSQHELLESLSQISSEQLKHAYDNPIEPEAETAYETIRTAVIHRIIYKLCVPKPLRHLWTCYRGLHYIKDAWHDLRQRRLTVEVLDASAISVSILRGDFAAASSIQFLLSLSDRLEANTLRSSHHNLKESLALSIDKVWLIEDGAPRQVKAASIQPGDEIIVTKGSMIPFDGIVTKGQGAVNEASLTGESFPIHRHENHHVSANTVLEEGELTIRVTQVQSESAIAKLVKLITESEQLKSSDQKMLERTANRLVKFNFIGLGLTYLLTRNINKALSFLLVDFSCALRLIGPLTYLTAMKDASDHQIIIKGAKFIEEFSKCDTYVFDKTGTLTSALPVVRKVIPLADYDYDEVVRVAACLEEHFYHPIADAIVQLAEEEEIEHDEMHTSINYIVAHGIESSIDGKRVTIGSKHFILEDEETPINNQIQEIIDRYESRYNLLYLAYDGQLIGIFCIDAMIRPETKATLKNLKAQGKRLILLTGDQEVRTESFIEELGVEFDHVYSEVSPEKKYEVVKLEQAAGRKVIMVGDGINDSAALSLADIGVVLKDTSDLARQVSDIILTSDRLDDLLCLDLLSRLLRAKLKTSTRFILGFNGALIFSGIVEWLNSSAIAFLHNFSTFGISFYSLRPILKKERNLKPLHD